MNDKELTKELKKLDALLHKASVANRAYLDQKAKLAKDCQHPASHVEEYTWEHDDGYGTQSMHKGNQCHICWAEDAWKTGRFYKLEDFKG